MRCHHHYSGPRSIALRDLDSQMAGDHRVLHHSLHKMAKKVSDIDRQIPTQHMSKGYQCLNMYFNLDGHSLYSASLLYSRVSLKGGFSPSAKRYQ